MGSVGFPIPIHHRSYHAKFQVHRTSPCIAPGTPSFRNYIGSPLWSSKLPKKGLLAESGNLAVFFMISKAVDRLETKGGTLWNFWMMGSQGQYKDLSYGLETLHGNSYGVLEWENLQSPFNFSLFYILNHPNVHG